MLPTGSGDMARTWGLSGEDWSLSPKGIYSLLVPLN